MIDPLGQFTNISTTQRSKLELRELPNDSTKREALINTYPILNPTGEVATFRELVPAVTTTEIGNKDNI